MRAAGAPAPALDNGCRRRCRPALGAARSGTGSGRSPRLTRWHSGSRHHTGPDGRRCVGCSVGRNCVDAHKAAGATGSTISVTATANRFTAAISALYSRLSRPRLVTTQRLSAGHLRPVDGGRLHGIYHHTTNATIGDACECAQHPTSPTSRHRLSAAAAFAHAARNSIPKRSRGSSGSATRSRCSASSIRAI